MNLVHGISPIRRRFIIHIAKPYIPDPFSFLQKKKLSFNFFYNYLILISRFVLSPFHSFIVYSLNFFFFFFRKNICSHIQASVIEESDYNETGKIEESGAVKSD